MKQLAFLVGNIVLASALLTLAARAQVLTPPPPPPPNANLPRVPAYQTIPGQPIDTRAPERKDIAPAFAGQTHAPYRHAADVTVTQLTGALRAPWAVAQLPDGALLVTEKMPGAMRIVGQDGSVSAPLTGLAGLGVTLPSTGLLDVILDKDFARNHTIFFTYFAYDGHMAGNTAIARAVLDRKAKALRDVKVLRQTLPLLPNDATLNAGGKTGGRLALGPDGYLYAAIGDRDDAGVQPWGVAQMLDTDLGKVLRLTKDGYPAPGNPFTGKTIAEPDIKALPQIWAYGVRSTEGLAFAPNGDLYETEHGPRGGDELNLIRKGANYGWPAITYGLDYGGKPVGDGKSAEPGMEQPVYYWSPSTAPSGLAFYTGSNPGWKNSIFAGMLKGRMLSRLTLKDGKVVDEEALLTDLKERIRDVRMGHDGSVYVLTDTSGSGIAGNGAPTSRLLKLTPK